MRRLSLAHALLACVVAPVAAQHASDTATSDTALTVQGFLQRDDQFDLWTIVVPLHVQALGVRTFVVPLVGKRIAGAGSSAGTSRPRAGSPACRPGASPASASRWRR